MKTKPTAMEPHFCRIFIRWYNWPIFPKLYANTHATSTTGKAVAKAKTTGRSHPARE